MNIKQWLSIDYLPILLITVMIITRYHHFGDVLHLPDASLVVFFCAGHYRRKILFFFLLALAGLVDYVAIANGTSSWCVSPAYAFLIPTYGVMWFAGLTVSRLSQTGLAKLTSQFGMLTLATVAAFVISNGSFYLFSGRYSSEPIGHYIELTGQYFWPYLSSVLIYGILGFIVLTLLQSFHIDITQPLLVKKAGKRSFSQ